MRMYMSSRTQGKLSGIHTNQRGPSDLEQRPSGLHMHHRSNLYTLNSFAAIIPAHMDMQCGEKGQGSTCS